MPTQDTIDTLIRFKLNVPELKADFRAVANEVEKLNAAAITAGRGVGASVDAARGLIGVRAFTDIRKEISSVISAFDTLKTTGKLSGRELEATFNAATQRVQALKAELTKNVSAGFSPFDALGKARGILGVRGGAGISEEVNQVKAAFRGLRDSGQLSGQELSTAFSAARKRLRELRDEAKGAQFQSVFAGAPTNGPPGSGSSARSSFLSQVSAQSLGNLTGAFTVAQLAANALTRSIEIFFSALASGVVFLKETEQRTFGIAAILTSMTEIANVAPTFNQSLSASSGVIQRLNDAALVTAASSRDLTAAFQGIVGPGLAAKLTLDQIIQLAVTGVNAVKSLGLNQTQVVQEIRDLVQGGIQPASSTLATALGIRDSDINRLKGNGQAFFDFLNERLKGFGVASQRFGETFAGAFDQLKDVFTRLNARATFPVFEAMRMLFVEIVNNLIKINRETGKVTFSPEALRITSSIADGFTAAVAAARNLAGSLGGLSEIFDVFAESAKLFTRTILVLFDVMRVMIGAFSVSLFLVTKTLSVISQTASKLSGLVGVERPEVDAMARLYDDIAENAKDLGLTLITAKPSLDAFNESLVQGSRKAKESALDTAAFTANVQSIIADSSRVAQSLKTDVAKTADEANKLLLILESLRGKTVNSTQKTQVQEQLSITRAALGRSAKDFKDALKPAIDSVTENAKQLTDALTSSINVRAGVRNLAEAFRQVRIELAGTAEGVRDISLIQSTGAIADLGQAFSKIEGTLASIAAKADSTKSAIRGSFDEANRQLSKQNAEELGRRGNANNSGIVGLQNADSARSLAERQTRELAEIDRQSAVERRQIYEQYFQTIQGLAQTALQRYKEYATKVIDLDKQIRNNRLDLQTSEFDINRQGKDPQEQLRSVRVELAQLRQQTAAAVAQNDDQLVSSLIGRRRQLARELLSLGGEGERNNALKENRTAAEQQIALLEKQKKAAIEARDNQLNTFLALQAVLADVKDKIEQINANAVAISVTLDQASLQSVLDQIRSAISNIVATVRVQAVIESVGGGTAGFAGGGYVRGPGSGTSDSILARLSNQEWVMRAAAVKFWGKDFMSDINAMRVPGFSTGGSPSGGGGGSRDSMDLNFNLGGSQFRLSGQREQVRGLVDALHAVSRGVH